MHVKPSGQLQIVPSATCWSSEFHNSKAEQVHVQFWCLCHFW